jgi:hypothetical protein
MAIPSISVINLSSNVKADEVQALIPALQQQVDNDFAPVWNTAANLALIPPGEAPPRGSWWLVLADHSEQAGAAGYHDLTPDGLPLGKVFTKTDVDGGLNWTVTASHEVLEMLVDPSIDLVVFAQTRKTGGTLYAREVCDPCEHEDYSYEIDGVRLSDFVYPAWFDRSQQEGLTQFDFGGHLTAPLQPLPGGHVGAFELSSGGWHLVTPGNEHPAYTKTPPVGSRRERRHRVREDWLASDVTSIAQEAS